MIISKQPSQNNYLRVVIQTILKMTNFSREIILQLPLYHFILTIPKQHKAKRFNNDVEAYDNQILILDGRILYH